MKSDVYICSSSVDIKVLYGNCFYILIYAHARNDGKCFTRFTLEIYCHNLPHCSLQKLEIYKETILNCREVNLPWYLPKVLAWNMKNLFLQILEISYIQKLTRWNKRLSLGIYHFNKISCQGLLSPRVVTWWLDHITRKSRVKWFWTENISYILMKKTTHCY